MAATAPTPTEGRDDLLNWDRVQAEESAAIEHARLACGLAGTREKVGLALSGGGIRSATFSLGVIQSLAKNKLLSRIDYLSTVSGGGYVGAWFSAWNRHKTSSVVDKELQKDARDPERPVEPFEVTWLRRYSNYLAPKLGLLSADSMTLVATWLRNVALNLVVVATFLASVFLMPRLLLVPATFGSTRMNTELGYAAVWLAFFILPLGIWTHFTKYFMNDQGKKLILMNSTWGVLFIVILPGTLAAVLGSLSVFGNPRFSGADVMAVAGISAVLLLLAGLASIALQRYLPRQFGETSSVLERLVFVMAFIVANLTGAALVILFHRAIRIDTPVRFGNVINVLTFGPPALMLTFGAMGSVIVGLVGRFYQEQTREWWSRMNAWFIIIGCAWLVLVGLSFYAAPLLAWAEANLGTWTATIAGVGWVGSLLTTLFAKGPVSTERPLGKLAAVGLNTALVVVVAGLLIGVAGGIGFALESWKPSAENTAKGSPPKISPTAAIELQLEARGDQNGVLRLVPVKHTDTSLDAFLNASFVEQDRVQRSCVYLREGADIRRGPAQNLLDCENLKGIVDPVNLIFFGCMFVFFLFGVRVDVNKFSLHNMYKNRLIRCYLGARRYDERKAHPFTGFDEEDDIPLMDLAHTRPFHIINAALNITQGRHLAWQERKAASFTFSPLHCGFMLGRATGDAEGAKAMSSSDVRVGGYRRSASWASRWDERKHFTLGMALATSGAAFSPIRGQGSTPATAFLATLFNIRLGRWSPNPLSRSTWDISSPVFGFVYLLKELFGYANETSKFVYLSDGGHFDNTGVYELVRRKCTTIIAVDATADLTRGFDDLGNLVRKCRVDLGVDIRFKFELLGTENEPSTPSQGYVIGEIHYPGLPPGRLILIKPTLINRALLGVDVFSYSRGRRTFPHQTTVDQFFSESQFESYRALGERIGNECLKDPEARFPAAEPAPWQQP